MNSFIVLYKNPTFPPGSQLVATNYIMTSINQSELENKLIFPPNVAVWKRRLPKLSAVLEGVRVSRPSLGGLCS